MWYYAPTLDFPVDRIKPGFFIGIADTICDEFSYMIVPAKSVGDIPQRHVKPIICLIVRLCDLGEDQSPIVQQKDDGSLEFLNSKGVSLPDSDLSEQYMT